MEQWEGAVIGKKGLLGQRISKQQIEHNRDQYFMMLHSTDEGQM